MLTAEAVELSHLVAEAVELSRGRVLLGVGREGQVHLTIEAHASNSLDYSVTQDAQVVRETSLVERQQAPCFELVERKISSS